MQRLWRRIGISMFWLTWPGSRLVLPMTIRTRLLLTHKGQVLVVRTWLSDGRWGLPGGGLHAGEKPIDGVLRELHEETGLTLGASQLSEDGRYTFRQDGLSFSYHLFTARAQRRYKAAPRSLDIVECAWMAPSELTAATASNDVLMALHAWSGSR